MTQFTVGAVADDLSVYRPRDASPEVRNEVYERDGGKCRQCGATEKLEYDHIIPWAYGGANTAENIQLLCKPCNRAKSGSLPEALTERERLILEKHHLTNHTASMKAELAQLRGFQAQVDAERGRAQERRGGKIRSAPVIPVTGLEADIASRVQQPRPGAPAQDA